MALSFGVTVLPDPPYQRLIELLRAVRDKLADAGYAPANIDATVACETPKLSPFRDEMRSRIAQAAGLAIGPTGTAYLGVTGGLIALRDG